MEKSKFMMVIIITLLLLLLGTVVGVSIYVMSLINSQKTVPEDNTQVVSEVELKGRASISLGDPIVTNLATVAGDRQKHFIRVSGTISYDNTVKRESDALTTLLNDNIHVARSVALACIKASTYEDLSDLDAKANMEDKILKRLQEEFSSNLIVRVYLEEFLLQ